MFGGESGEFLAMLSHEIRTPLSGILGFARLLSEAPIPTKQKDYAQTIIKSADAMLRILDDLLDFSCMEAGDLRIEAHPFAVRPMVEEVHSLLALQAQQKFIFLETEIAADIPEELVGDAGRLRQVLINLASNAIKFTDAGAVTIAVFRHPVLSRIVFCVRDTGTGILPETLPGILNPFIRCRQKEGSGLGLPISKRLVELMGGFLCVKTQHGSGSLFLFSLPLVTDTAKVIEGQIEHHQQLPDFG